MMPCLNMTVFGFNIYFVLFKFNKFDSRKEKKLVAFLKKHEHVSWITKVAGGWDFTIMVVARNNFEFDRVLMELKGFCASFLKETEFFHLLYEYKYSSLIRGALGGAKISPLSTRRADASFQKELENAEVELKPWPLTKTEPVSESDLRMLEILAEDARKPLSGIAASLNCTMEKARYKIKKLIEKGILVGFWAMPSFTRLGYSWYRLLIKAHNVSDEREEELRKFFKNHPLVFWAAKILGKWDIIVDVNVKSLAQFSQIADEINRRFYDIILDYESILMLKEYKYTHFVRAYYKAAGQRNN
jgi:DNA-binding Lrp family transcriptional regulator